jgi:drug/metabolite transporter (DMT)-like permease
MNTLSTELIALTCGLLAAISWGIADVLSAKTALKHGFTISAITVNIIGALGFSVFFLAAFPFSLHHLTTAGIKYAVLAAIALGIGQLTLFRSLKLGPVNLVSPLSSSYPFFSLIGIAMVFKVHLRLNQILGAILVMLGVLIAGEILSIRKHAVRENEGPILAVITAVTWGIGYVLLSQALQFTDWQTVTLIQFWVIVFVCLALSPAIKDTDKLFPQGWTTLFRNRNMLAAGLIQAAGMVFINIGLNQSASLVPAVTAISACYPIIAILLAFTHLKEKVRLIPLYGSLLCIAGVVILLM